jgi:Homocysteine S-methyltransferase
VRSVLAPACASASLRVLLTAMELLVAPRLQSMPVTAAQCLQVEQFFEKGLVNAIGGCCGSSYPHIAALVETAAAFAPRQKHGVELMMRISGLEPLNYVRFPVSAPPSVPMFAAVIRIPAKQSPVFFFFFFAALRVQAASRLARRQES